MQSPVQPAIFGGFNAWSAGLHEILSVEMRSRGIGRTCGVNDGQLLLVPDRLQCPEGRVQSKEAVEIKHRLARDVDRWPHLIVRSLAMRDNNIETVGCSALKDDHQ